MSSSATYFLPSSSTASTPGSGRAAITKPRRWIDAGDPSTGRLPGDYVVEGGDFKQDAGWTSKVYLALSTKLGSCQVLPGFGSRLHEIRHADETGRRLSESYALMALQHLTQDIQDLQVVATLPPNSPGRIDLVVSGRNGTTQVQVPYSRTISG
jgi:phage gp46-like protein